MTYACVRMRSSDCINNSVVLEKRAMDQNFRTILLKI